jgi:mRNA-degrading endonuclease toxin of MazEF toxin-antitoxin module
VSFDKTSLAILSQVRIVDKRRFINPIGLVSEEEILIIKKLLKDIYLTGV